MTRNVFQWIFPVAAISLLMLSLYFLFFGTGYYNQVWTKLCGAAGIIATAAVSGDIFSRLSAGNVQLNAAVPKRLLPSKILLAGNCSPPLAKISDFSGRFEQA